MGGKTWNVKRNNENINQIKHVQSPTPSPSSSIPQPAPSPILMSPSPSPLPQLLSSMSQSLSSPNILNTPISFNSNNKSNMIINKKKMKRKPLFYRQRS